MIKIADLVPTNLQEEKIKFFASGYTYNPQFHYDQPIDESQLTQYGRPKWWLLWQAKWIVWRYKNNLQKHPIHLEKDVVSKKEIELLIENRLSLYNINREYSLLFSDKFVGRIAVNLKHKQIKIRTPIQINKHEIEAVLAHEIDTHLLRQKNSEKQVWHGSKKKFGFKNHTKTEEGLAVINEMIAAKQTLPYKQALNYLSIDLALKSDFVSVFNFFLSAWNDPERAWTWTVKKKRGLTDTSRKGGFTKDVVYFEGLISVLKYAKKNNYDLQALYYGKIDVDDVKQAIELSPQYRPILPFIITKDSEAYKTKLQQICLQNLAMI